MSTDALQRLVRDALAPFHDHTLDRRIKAARNAWSEQARAALEAVVDYERLEELGDEVQQQLDAVRERVAEINQKLRGEVEGLILPDVPEIPQPEITEMNGVPLIDSNWDYVSQTRRLIAHRAYKETR